MFMTVTPETHLVADAIGIVVVMVVVPYIQQRVNTTAHRMLSQRGNFKLALVEKWFLI